MVNYLQESLNGTLTSLAIVSLLPYLFLAPVDTADSFRVCPNDRDRWGFLQGWAVPQVWGSLCCQTHEGGEGDGEQRGEGGTLEQMCVKVLHETGPLQNRHQLSPFPLGKLAYY